MPPRTARDLALGASALAVLGLVAFVVLRRAPSTDSDASGSKAVASSSAAVESARAPKLAPFDRAAPREQFVGSAVCTPCHQAEALAYAKSHHARALVLPTPENFGSNLGDAVFSTPLGGTTRFGRNHGAPEVSSRDTSGQTKSFAIAYVAGVFPLQQFIVPTERGKLQTLGVSWDTRPAKDGGQRFFHVYGPRGVAHDDGLFFTRPTQNWNHVCADCHSTFVERRYDAAADRFDTRWAELAVGCESCHGPGAAHVRAAKAATSHAKGAYASTLSVTLRPSAPWSPSASGSPSPRAPDDTELEVCAPCHSRRASLREGFIAGDALLDAFEPELLQAGGYHADGQVEGEVYEWGSFLQSKMHASGVRCSDCHEPHSAELRAPGNALCATCHAPARFDAESHTHHGGEKAPSCIDCHMPPSTFMQIDERRDHSIRIPRPDLSVAFGAPNACNGCHKQTPAWALEHLTKWQPASARRPHFGEALGRVRKGALDAPRALNALARDPTAPAIARATALEELADFPSNTSVQTVRAALASPEPLVVYGAVRGASAWPLELRAPLMLAVIDHPRRAVRIAAAKALAELPPENAERGRVAALERAFAEVEQSFAVSASIPQSHVERSAFELARGKPDEAVRALETALRLSPCLAEAHLNLADVARIRKDEATAEREVRAAIACAPKNAHAHHALGLWLVRNGKKREALASLRKAANLAPADARMSYVLAVAVADDGDVAEAVKILDTALEKNANDQDLLHALAGYLQKLDQKERAADIAARVVRLLRE